MAQEPVWVDNAPVPVIVYSRIALVKVDQILDLALAKLYQAMSGMFLPFKKYVLADCEI